MQKYGCKTDINCPEMACSSWAIRVKIVRVIEILQEKNANQIMIMIMSSAFEA
jgi:hypothetical protein